LRTRSSRPAPRRQTDARIIHVLPGPRRTRMKTHPFEFPPFLFFGPLFLLPLLLLQGPRVRAPPRRSPQSIVATTDRPGVAAVGRKCSPPSNNPWWHPRGTHLPLPLPFLLLPPSLSLPRVTTTPKPRRGRRRSACEPADGRREAIPRAPATKKKRRVMESSPSLVFDSFPSHHHHLSPRR